MMMALLSYRFVLRDRKLLGCGNAVLLWSASEIEYAFAFVYFLILSQDESRAKIFIPVGSKSGL